jgi:hypothetical protein
MAANQPNKQYYNYLDDNGQAWSKFGSNDAACAAINGAAAFVAGSRVWPRQTKKYRAREAIFQDPQTFRTARCIVYTPTAFNAITGTSTLAVNVPGETATVTYSLSQKVPEKQPVAKASRQLADHT